MLALDRAQLHGAAKDSKKWDKTNHSSKGREQLRKYWNDHQYQMLYSSLILELRAVAGMLEGGEDGPHWKLDGDEDEIDGSSLRPSRRRPNNAHVLHLPRHAVQTGRTARADTSSAEIVCCRTRES